MGAHFLNFFSGRRRQPTRGNLNIQILESPNQSLDSVSLSLQESIAENYLDNSTIAVSVTSGGGGQTSSSHDKLMIVITLEADTQWVTYKSTRIY